jgi:hypothetical protein
LTAPATVLDADVIASPAVDPAPVTAPAAAGLTPLTLEAIVDAIPVIASPRLAPLLATTLLTVSVV